MPASSASSLRSEPAQNPGRINEHYYRHVYATKAELVAAIDKWVTFYNSVRRHSAIGMLSPDTYERSLTAAA
ncbi:integrase core domain-containing protein [Amycolatopsis jiangsuensis]|uniref:integrase core domain-containing protein n=1 Tax=Amycolatopsis jiangsuensis TaxID=1181879 RepID=UPI0035E46280